MDEVVGSRVLSGDDVAAYLSGKTVAVVGNASSALQAKNGDEIDAHDVVLRLNAGVPLPEQKRAIGSRTDVLSVGNLAVLKDSMHRLRTPPDQVWFGKPSFSALGRREWPRLVKIAHYPIWRIPSERMEGLKDEIGAWPSGGLVAAFIVLEHADVIHLYGFDCFSSPTWWHTDRPAAKIPGPFRHEGEKEREWMKKHGLL